MNASEEYTLGLCHKTFLSLWSYANPRSEPGKELCDVLVVCDPDVVVFSVKDIQFRDTGDFAVNAERWSRKAVDESIHQLYGAKRWLEQASHVIRKDGTLGLTLPPTSRRRLHLVAVALGADGQLPIASADTGKGFVHVLQKESLERVMLELDTVTDLAAYLQAKEEFLSRTKIVVEGGEENLLALYLTHNRSFPFSTDVLVVDDTLWKGFNSHAQVKARRELDKVSYAWDRLIETLAGDIEGGNLQMGSSLSENELAIRAIARENRFCRRLIGRAFMEFVERSVTDVTSRARMLLSPSGVGYVFLTLPQNMERKYRIAELGMRCFIARGTLKNCVTVIGIATESRHGAKGFSLDVIRFHQTEWTNKDQLDMEEAQSLSGFFKSPVSTNLKENEYPTTNSATHLAEPTGN